MDFYFFDPSLSAISAYPSYRAWAQSERGSWTPRKVQRIACWRLPASERLPATQNLHFSLFWAWLYVVRDPFKFKQYKNLPQRCENNMIGIASTFQLLIITHLLTFIYAQQYNLSTSMSTAGKPETETLITDSIVSVQQQQAYIKKSFFKRAFSPIQPGAMRGSIFALLASAMGTGMFNLPYRINQTGVIPFFVFVIAGGLFSYFGMYLISRLIIKYKFQSYSEMSEKAYGNVFRKIAEFCLIIYPWGITVCFQVIFAKFAIQLLDDTFDLGFYELNGRSEDKYSSKGQLFRIIISIGAIIVNLIFVLKKQIGVLQKIAIIGVFSVVINVGIIFITFIFGFTAEIVGEEKEIDIIYDGVTGIVWDNIKWWNLDGWDAISQQAQGIASIIFCYVNHQLVFPLVFDLKNPSKRRLDKIFNRVHITQVIIYTFVGMSGYLLLEEYIEQRPISSIVMASISTASMSIGKCFMVVSLFFAVPLNLFPCRQVLYEAFSLEKNTQSHVIISLFLAFSGTVIAIFFQQVNSYFGLLGGTAGVMMAGGIPVICYYKLLGLKRTSDKLIAIFMLIVSLVGMFGAILSVISPS